MMQEKSVLNTGHDAVKEDLLTLFDQREEALCDLIFHLDDGQAVLAHHAIVDARLHTILASAEPVREADPMTFLMDGCGPGKVRQVKLHGIAAPTLNALLRWAYGEAVPSIGESQLTSQAGPGALQQRRPRSPRCVRTVPLLSLESTVVLLEACGVHDVERLGALLREAALESLDLDSFAVLLRESHVRRLQDLKQGCKRFALHHFDELVEQPHSIFAALQEFPEVVSELFQLSRQYYDRGHSGRGGSPRPAPAPPSTFVADLERLFDAARQAEDRGRSNDKDGDEVREDSATPRSEAELAPDCQIVVGQDMYLGHAAMLAARSDFFAAAFSAGMAERHSLVVTLQHVASEDACRSSVFALLYFLYTGRISRVSEENAFSVLALIGGEALDNDGSGTGGYLQLHDAATLRAACEASLETLAEREVDFLSLLEKAHKLGATRLKQRALDHVVHHFKELASSAKLARLSPSLLQEVHQKVASEYADYLPSPATSAKWELYLSPTPDGRMANTYDSLITADLTCGAGAIGAAGCSDACLVASFNRLVRVRRLRVGADLSSASGDLNEAGMTGLHETRLQYQSSSGSWQDAGVTISMKNGVVQEIELPKALVAKAFRLVRKQRLAVGLLSFA